MAKTRIDSRGVVTTPGGSGVTLGSATTFSKGATFATSSQFQEEITLKSGSISDVVPIGADANIVRGGVYTLSGDSEITASLPTPADVPGAMFIFRSISAHAHMITSSNVTQDLETITDGSSEGARIALDSVIGSSAALVCDGRSYLVLASSGTVTYATPAG